MSEGRVAELLPLKPLVFRILLVLHDAEMHGYAIVRTLDEREGGLDVQPANLYRTLRWMLAAGLVRESDRRPDPELDDERRRYFTLTPLGADAAAAEAARMEGLVAAARRRSILEAGR